MAIASGSLTGSTETVGVAIVGLVRTGRRSTSGLVTTVVCASSPFQSGCEGTLAARLGAIADSIKATIAVDRAKIKCNCFTLSVSSTHPNVGVLSVVSVGSHALAHPFENLAVSRLYVP